MFFFIIIINPKMKRREEMSGWEGKAKEGKGRKGKGGRKKEHILTG